ncbi:hypothetical protein BZA05DRAFT_442074 [Tricharina praecox]|uniref:uncharacterized protein n=1 Tax=Tricharina praecox TaxID=43433 RepID=UPI00221F9C7B|nr:uncharacterized protein BZA05DRAFT_442074 [Tricharina praecox]KAI5856382.1 hypothetical protein BZA05DRAFT_442074 [Tricharina praecox]
MSVPRTHRPGAATTTDASAAAGVSTGSHELPTDAVSSEVSDTQLEYIVYVRLPFPRRGFVNPPQVCWNEQKERHLWRTVMREDRTQPIDWNKLAEDLQVTPLFCMRVISLLINQEQAKLMKAARRPSTFTAPRAGSSTLSPESELLSPSSSIMYEKSQPASTDDPAWELVSSLEECRRAPHNVEPGSVVEWDLDP